MSVMDKFLNAMKLNDEDDDFYDDDYYDEPDPIKKSQPVKEEMILEEEKAVKKVTPKVTPMRQMRKMSDAGMEVCVIKPTTVEDAREITETLLANRTVVLNLEGLDVEIAQRIIDFIITPASVDISGDFQEILSGSFDVPINNGL